MSNIQLPSSLANAKVKTYIRGDENIQAVANVNPLSVLTGNITANGQTLDFDVTDAATALLSVIGTYTSVAVAFEASIDGTNFFAIMGVQTDAATFATASGTLSSTNRAWEFGVAGFTKLRVRSTAYTSGTMIVHCGSTPMGYDPAGAAQVSVVGTPTVNMSGKTTGGVTGAKLISAATTNATSLKASAGTLYGGRVFNSGASAAFLKLYNKASAPTVGTDTPIMVIGIPAGQSVDLGIGNSIGIAFGTGIAYAITGGAADSDTTAVALNQVSVSLYYQ